MTWIKDISPKTRDIAIILALFLLAAFLRLPGLDHPQTTIFDEPVYANFTIKTNEHIPFFDIHPPFIKLLFARVAGTMPYETSWVPIEFNADVGDFPLHRERVLVAIFGIFLVPVVYVAARMLGLHPPLALIPALLVALDNGLIISSRAMLPDMIILTLEFSAFALALLGLRMQRGSWGASGMILASALVIGVAVASKWTALGIFGVIMLLYLQRGAIRAMIATAVTVPVVYIAIFLIYFSGFPPGVPMQQVLSYLDLPSVRALQISGDIWKDIALLPRYHAQMAQVNSDPGFIAHTLAAPGASSWPFARNPMVFWKDTPSRSAIVFWGNPYAWIIAFALGVALLGILFIREGLERPKAFLMRPEILLAVGFVANYIPFLLISRPMYPYHYFPALMFLYLLFPFAVREIAARGKAVIGEQQTRIILATLLLPIPLVFLLLLPMTYGWATI